MSQFKASNAEVTLFHSVQTPIPTTTARDLCYDLRERYGVYNVQELPADTELERTDQNDRVIRIDGAAICFSGDKSVTRQDEDYLHELSTFALGLSFDTSELSVRGNHADLNRYILPDGSLDVLRDPRPWIANNAFMRTLVETDPRYDSLISFIRDERGLFIKPSRYKNQRNHWNAPTNGGLPIIRKRDEIHEGTFMAHDLEHFAIQDPLPFSFSQDPEQLRIYLRHRMASEATTLALTDMVAVDIAGLKDDGYDTAKRRIFPLYESMHAMFEGASIGEVSQYLMAANILYALTGDIGSFTALEADPKALADYAEKYEVFFSADYDWNKENYVRVQREVEANPRMVDYFRDILEQYDIPLVETIYPTGGTVDDIMQNFTEQVDQAFTYTSRPDATLRGNRLAATRYLAGQQVIFYRFADIEGASLSLAAYKEATAGLLESTDVAAQAEHASAANAIYQRFVNLCAHHGRIHPQEVELYRMHAPLYPPLFINYAIQGGDYRDLSQKMRADGIYR